MTDLPESGPEPEAEPERGLDAAARKDTGWGPRLKTLADALSARDKSVLIAMLEGEAAEDKLAMTSRGSANDWFRAHLSRVGLMKVRPEAVPDALREVVIAYALTPEGRKHLPSLLPGLF